MDSTREAPTQPLLTLMDYWLTGPYRTWRTLQYGLRDPLRAKLPRFGIPVLVIRGARDPISPYPWAAEVAALLPYARLVAIPGAAHTVNYSVPARLVRVLRPFLRHANHDRIQAAE